MTYESLWRRLSRQYEADEAKAIVRWVLDVRFGLSWADIICEKTDQLALDDQQELETIMQRLESGEPVQYIMGIADFCGRQFHVEPGVLIPRPETAELCAMILSRPSTGKHILDIGTGSGCIAITLALDIPGAHVAAWDISDDALRVARANAEVLGASVTFEHRDALDSSLITLPRWDLIVSNPPYIQPKERDEMAKNVLCHEPGIALFAPEDNPIVFYQRIADYAWQSLNAGGELYFELNPLTAADVSNHLRHLGFAEIEISHDQYGKQRFLKAKKI